MKTIIRSIAIVAAVVSVAPLALAGPAPKTPPVKCPKCHMELAMKKDKVHTVAVKIKNKTYYCCATCGAHVKAKGAPPKVKSAHTH